MTTHLPRSAWTTTAAAGTELDAGDVRGVALHWPGLAAPLGVVDQATVAAMLRGWLSQHRAQGWVDIAYQAAVDQAGRVWDLRGIRRQSAANGDALVNQRYGALLLVVGPGEQLTTALVDAVRSWLAVWRATYPHAAQVVAHSDVRPGGTACPGDVVRQALAGGTFSTTPPQGDDEMTPEQQQKLDDTHRMVGQLVDWLLEAKPDPDTGQPRSVAGRVGVLHEWTTKPGTGIAARVEHIEQLAEEATS